MEPIEDDALRQADLSQLRLQEMTAEERAELRRRYDDFVRHFTAPAPSAKTRGKAKAKKPRHKHWVPGGKG